MDEMITKALEKLDKEFNEKKGLGSKENAVAAPVYEALKLFCKQNGEFSQAVVNSSGTLSDCIKKTMNGCGNAISDLDVYKKAVAYYFPGSDVKFEMKIDLGDDGFSNIHDAPAKKSIALSLDDLFE
ncbi:MAG: hypothetical protein NC203_00490 [Firmicutes bacterium]|nr:hypothetical protein [[Eubacterium] siraeum]MCM1486817.1 hypothetical protein [Bacillota bacterium]